MLQSLPDRQTRKVSAEEFDRLAKLEQEVRAGLGYFSVADTWSRDELYERRR
jgi:hypothetical protein